MDLFAALPAITGKVEMVFEGEQQGAEIVAKKLIGDAVKGLFEAKFPPVEGPRTRAESRVWRITVVRGGQQIQVTLGG